LVHIHTLLEPDRGDTANEGNRMQLYTDESPPPATSMATCIAASLSCVIIGDSSIAPLPYYTKL